MNIYAESSAVLAWLLGEETAEAVRASLGSATHVVASDLTLVECDRVLFRAVARGEMTEGEASDRRAHLVAASAHWHRLRLAGDVVDRARLRFPGESIRALDALHLGAALAARSALAGLQFLSLDDRIRTAARQLGFRLQPD